MRSDVLGSHGGGGHTPSAHRRALALALLVLTVAGGGMAITGGSPRSVEPERPLPLPVDSVTGTLVSGGWWRASDLAGPALLLYVDEQCPWCKAELRTWASGAITPPPVTPIVILSSRSDPRFVPSPLRRSLVHDRTGSIARALGLRGVPALAVVTPHAITHLYYGVSSQGRLDSLRHLVTRPPSPPPPPPGVPRP